MPRSKNLRAFRVQPAIANAHLVDPVHQFGNEKKAEAGIAERLDATLRRYDDFRIFYGVLEIVFAEHEPAKGTGRRAIAPMVFLDYTAFVTAPVPSRLTRARRRARR